MNINQSLTYNFTKALNYYQSLSGKTKKEIAEAIDVPPTTYSSWSNGKHLPDMDKLQRLANYFKAPIEQFFNFTALTPPDTITQEMLDTFSQLSSEEKLLVRSLTQKLIG
jgi:transcriptional regulator with XRE-family HTH domain